MAVTKVNTGKLRRVRTDDPILNDIQDTIQTLADQVDDARRGTEGYLCRVCIGGEQLAEDTIVVFRGKGTQTLTLPSTQQRSRGRGFRLTILHGGTGMLVVMGPMATGATSVVVAPGEMLIAVSDGFDHWWVK